MTLRPTNFRLESELLDGLLEVKARVGISVSEQVRRAIRAWLDRQGVSRLKTARKRAATRKRA